MVFKRKIPVFTFLLGLVVVLGYFFLSREQEESTPRTETEIAGRTFKHQPSIGPTSSESTTDHAGKAEDEEEESIQDLEHRAFSDPETEERIGAVQREDGKQSLATLVAILHTDKEVDVREAALDALEEHQGLSFEVVTPGLVRLNINVEDDDGEGCQAATVALDATKNARIFEKGPKVLKRGKSLQLHYLVTYDCTAALKANKGDATPGDYSYVATVHHDALERPIATAQTILWMVPFKPIWWVIFELH